MGRSHMVVSGTSYLAAGALAGHLTGTQVGPTELACGTVVAMGIGGLLPDMDTTQSTLARALGPLTLGVAKVIGTVFGGHRQGTHSPVFCVAAGGLASLALTQTGLVRVGGLTLTVGALVALVIGFFSVALVLGRLLKIHGSQCAALAGVIVALALLTHPQPGLIPGAVVLGSLSHLLADWMTPEGIAPLWPISRRRAALPLVGRTGDWREHVVVALVLLGGCALTYRAFAPAVRAQPAVAAAAHDLAAHRGLGR
jgi:membrane-bound metal-dependent hydrolase YbcI (DUF457 family)